MGSKPTNKHSSSRTDENGEEKNYSVGPEESEMKEMKTNVLDSQSESTSNEVAKVSKSIFICENTEEASNSEKVEVTELTSDIPEETIFHETTEEMLQTSSNPVTAPETNVKIADSKASLSSLIRKISNFLSKEAERSQTHVPNESGEMENSSCDRANGTKSRKRSRRQVVISYPQSHKPRQPFMNQPSNNRPPNPPSYYTSAVTREQHQPYLLRANNEEHREQRVQFQNPQNQSGRPREEIVLTPNMNYQPGQMMMMPNAAMNFAYWAPYPENIPPNVPACLAHLYAAESLFIIQQMDIIELFMDISEPNYYLIQDTAGRCLYYAYETTDVCAGMCCYGNRGLQLHVMDMYHNEIIYMNKPCGCNNWFCCYPVLEVYSPPLVPVGAITQKFSLTSTAFSILDADENKMFEIHGPCCCYNQCRCGEADFIITALDEEKTEVGVIRREAGTLITSGFTNTDFYGISFPLDLDVRIKAVFLGALFLIEYSYFDTR